MRATLIEENTKEQEVKGNMDKKATQLLTKKTVIIPKVIIDQKRLEQVCMDEVEKRRRLLEGSPPMVEPLVNLLQYSRITTFTNQVLLGETPQIKDINEYIQLYPDQLGTPQIDSDRVLIYWSTKPDNNRVHCLRPILLLDLEANMHNKRLGQVAIMSTEYLQGIADEQYGSRKNKLVDTQTLNTCV
eukprot:1621447-Ditylum_brightwellii.AAC.1